VLQDGTVQRLGGTRDVRFDARLVCATNVDIGQAIEEKRFRADLYHRINVIELEVPPLRERLLDLPILVDHFLKTYAKGEMKGVSREALDTLARYDWPGNVRELENVIQRALVTTRGPEIQPEDIRFAAAHRLPAAAAPQEAGDKISIPAEATLAEAEELLVESALRRTGGDKEKAARLLGVSSRTLYRRAKRPEDEF
jgi:DNA-binding NtrC family response regulator